MAHILSLKLGRSTRSIVLKTKERDEILQSVKKEFGLFAPAISVRDNKDGTQTVSVYAWDMSFLADGLLT